MQKPSLALPQDPEKTAPYAPPRRYIAADARLDAILGRTTNADFLTIADQTPPPPPRIAAALHKANVEVLIADTYS